MSHPNIEIVIDLAPGVRAEITLLFDEEAIQIWNGRFFIAAFDRPVLSQWLVEPWGSLTTNGSGFRLDTSSNPQGEVAITILDLGTYPLTRSELSQLTTWAEHR